MEELLKSIENEIDKELNRANLVYKQKFNSNHEG